MQTLSLIYIAIQVNIKTAHRQTQLISCHVDAVMHMYTHDRLWPKLSDLAAEIGSECHLLAASSGGNPFDEVMSCPWAALQDEFPDCDIPMACESTTIELRGELDVSE